MRMLDLLSGGWVAETVSKVLIGNGMKKVQENKNFKRLGHGE